MSALTISPEDEKRVKGMGFLNNRGTDLFSARVLTTNGKVTAREFDTLKSKKVPQSLEIGLFFCQIFIFII